MDTNTTLVIVIAVFAVIVVAGFIVFRNRAKVKITGPAGTGLEFGADNQPAVPTPGVKAEDIKAKNVTAEDQAGRGVDAKHIEAQEDVKLVNTPPTQDPKA
jgi:hypothetical protein